MEHCHEPHRGLLSVDWFKEWRRINPSKPALKARNLGDLLHVRNCSKVKIAAIFPNAGVINRDSKLDHVVPLVGRAPHPRPH